MFSSKLTHVIISCELMKKFFLKFWHFSIFWPFLHIFSLLKIAVNNNSAIFTNVLHLKNIWILPSNQEYILFVNLQHMLIFCQHLLTFGQHSLAWNCIHATQMNIISEYMRYVMEVTFGIPSLYGDLGSIFAAQGSCINSNSSKM